LSCEKTCCTAHSDIFGLWGLSEQIGEAHLGLGMFALRRKLGLVSENIKQGRACIKVKIEQMLYQATILDFPEDLVKK
jgi:hypothetical protein